MPSLPPGAPLTGVHSPADDAPALMARLRGGAGGSAALWWWQGQVHGKRPGEIGRLLLGIHGIGFSRMSREADGSWTLTMSEAGYYRDSDTGEIIDRWLNPYTGREVEPRHNRLRLRYSITADGIIQPSLPAGRFDGFVGPVTRNGDRVWVHERLAAEFPAKTAGGVAAPQGLIGEPMEMTSFSARLDDALRSDAGFVPATMDHGTIWSFYPWMGMTTDSGYVIMQIVGRKLGSPGEIPVALRRRIDADHPGLLEDPGI
jgi:hypothetical protein